MQVDEIVQPCFILGYEECIRFIALAVHIQRNALLLYGQVARVQLFRRAPISAWNPASFKALSLLSVTRKSQVNTLPNCLDTMSLMESFRPKPVTSSAVQPATPMTVMKKRFLYPEQVARRHLVGELHALPYRGDALQEDTLAGLGRLGQKAGRAARSLSVWPQASSVAALVHRSAAPTPSTASEAWNRQRNPGMVYMVP